MKNDDASLLLKRIPFKQKPSMLDFKLSRIGEHEIGLEDLKRPSISKVSSAI